MAQVPSLLWFRVAAVYKVSSVVGNARISRRLDRRVAPPVFTWRRPEAPRRRRNRASTQGIDLVLRGVAPVSGEEGIPSAGLPAVVIFNLVVVNT
jgi:hypothetical protein